MIKECIQIGTYTFNAIAEQYAPVRRGCTKIFLFEKDVYEAPLHVCRDDVDVGSCLPKTTEIDFRLIVATGTWQARYRRDLSARTCIIG